MNLTGCILCSSNADLCRAFTATTTSMLVAQSLFTQDFSVCAACIESHPFGVSSACECPCGESFLGHASVVVYDGPDDNGTKTQQVPLSSTSLTSRRFHHMGCILLCMGCGFGEAYHVLKGESNPVEFSYASSLSPATKDMGTYCNNCLTTCMACSHPLPITQGKYSRTHKECMGRARSVSF